MLKSPQGIHQNQFYIMTGFDTTKPLYALTIGEFCQLLGECLHNTADGGINNTAAWADKPTGRLVYGLAGIEELFHVSHKTAQYYKDHVIQEAVRQNGRKIVTDVDLALKLFNQRRTE